MPSFSRRSLVAVCLLLGVGGNGCGGGGSSTPVSTGPITSALKQTGDLQFTLTTPKTTYTRGEAVPFTFTVKNVGAQTASITNQLYLFRVTTIMQGSRLTARFPASNAESFYAFSLAPSTSKSESASWDQKDSNGQQVAAGQYALSSYAPIGSVNGNIYLATLPGDQWFAYWQANFATNPVTITIR